MRLPAGAMKVQTVKRQAALVDHEAGLFTLGRKPGLNLGLVFGAGLHGEEEMMWPLADIDASGPVQVLTNEV